MNMKEDIKGVDVSKVEQAVDTIGNVILGKEHAIRLALSCILARGHILIEDTPGVGKTTLSHAIAAVLGLNYHRIQFTSDLLPADILGVSVYNRENEKFEFHPGPVFSNVILADEINRAPPRTQSALLEAMAEYQVTIEAETRTLPKPFFVIATQNPNNQIGTFPLPESQLDRFLMCIDLGYPNAEAERTLLTETDRRDMIEIQQAMVTIDELLQMQKQVESIHVADAILDYLQDLLAFSRASGAYSQGLSPRAGLAVLNAARAWALLHGHVQVLPEDIQAILPSVIGHRLSFAHDKNDNDHLTPTHHLITHVAIP